ncbi:MAG: histidine phosphatase family protein [Pirellulaceae bacterium]
MIRIFLVLPGATDLDSQGRIKGSLDVPMNSDGDAQARRTADELSQEEIDLVYSSPCLSARQTAEQLSHDGAIKIKVMDELRNLDRGLWHGKLIEELKESQPRVYRQWSEQPETVQPPGGETLEFANKRIARILRKLLRRHKDGTIAMVVPEPVASLLRSQLENVEIGNLWKVECRCGSWETIEVGPDTPSPGISANT